MVWFKTKISGCINTKLFGVHLQSSKILILKLYLVMIEHHVFMLIMLKILEEIQRNYNQKNVLIGIKLIRY